MEQPVMLATAMGQTRTVTLVFTLEDGKDLNVTLSNAKDNLDSATITAVAEQIKDNNVLQKNGKAVVAFKQAYTTNISRTEIA